MNFSKICPHTSTKRVLFKIRAYREAAQISQREAAEKLSIGHRSYQRIENGEATFDILFLYRFCNLFGVEFNELVCPNPPKISQKIELINHDQIDIFKNIKHVQESKMLELEHLLESINFSIRDILESQQFINSSSYLCVSTPYKIFFNKACNDIAHITQRISPPPFLAHDLESIKKRIHYWDCLHFYSPKYSINRSDLDIIDENFVNYTEYAIHAYGQSTIFSLSSFEVV